MAHLRLAGVSDDGERLLLVSADGDEFTLDIEPRLRAALRAGSPRRMENQMDSTLRPRDIQSRIRAGESPEAVAEAAGTSVDRIMAYAAPVLAERQHIADRALRSSVRRRSGEAPGTVRTLGEAVAAHLRGQDVDPESVEWDAWRREDGRWALVGVFASGRRSGAAELTFDAPGSYVLLENEDARWLVGDAVDAPAAPRDDLEARRRRSGSAPEDELPLGDDALELVRDPESAPADAARTEASDQHDRHDQPIEAFLDASPGAGDERGLREQAADAAALDDGPAERPGDPAPPEPSDPESGEPSPRRPARKARGRASVPSWDEIMFGGGKQE